MTDIADVSIDLLTFSLAIGASFFAFLIRNKFKGGLLQKPWQIIGPAPLVYAFGELSHVFEEVTGTTALLEALHVVLEATFVLMLLYGFYSFHKAWTPKKSDKGE
ncbi:MAG TPA: hypothetical protein VGR56_03935 [Nitrososphaerales archaeon]|nr:hypothetical protein [Nitrososphaerales archaeon]